MIAYQTGLEGVIPDKLTGFFVGWSNPPTPVERLAVLKGSTHVVLATDEERVVGFIASHSDGVLSAYISLLEVLPSHQHRAIGSELVVRMLAMLDGLYMVDLLCDRELEASYSRFNMKPGFGMMVRNLRWRSNRV